MTQIVTTAEFAYTIQVEDLDTALGQLLLDLAQGLVVEELGELDPWPASAKTVVLAAAARAYFNPEGALSSRIDDSATTYSAAQAGVYLTSEEKVRLHNHAGRARFEFPGTWPYPDPVEATADPVSG